MEHNPAWSSSKGRQLPPLLPTRSGHNESSFSGTAYPITQITFAAQRRLSSTAACGACRKRKSKCNAKRPKCTLCFSQGTDCHYDTATSVETRGQALKRKYDQLSEQKSKYEKIYEILQARPVAEADAIFKRIREGGDADSVLKQVQEGDLLVQLALVPETLHRSRKMVQIPDKKHSPRSGSLRPPTQRRKSTGVDTRYL